jgi:hypothetical protein
VEFATVTIIMTTMSQKTAFVKANKNLVSSVKLTNAKIAGLTESEIDALVTEITAHADYSPEETTVATSVPVLEMEGVTHTEEFGSLLYLPFVGKTKKSFSFQYGDSLVYCNDGDLFLLQEAGKLVVGQTFAFKADTLQTSKNGVLNIRLNYKADATITAVNKAIDDYQSDIEAKIKARAKKRGIDYKTAEAQIYAIIDQQEEVELKASLPKFSL